MSATVPVYVEVEVHRVEWRLVHAATLDEACRIAERMPDVYEVRRSTYDEPAAEIARAPSP